MSLAVRAVRYGPPAFAALAQAVAGAKGDDPFRPVTVVVPRGTVGLAARRRLAAAPGGILNVRHMTLAQLAADLALPSLAATGRRPVTPALVHEAVRAALASRTTGVLAAVRDQPATVRALARTVRELEGASAATLASLTALGPRTREVIEAVRAVRALLANRFTDAELLRVAAAQLAATGAPGSADPLSGLGAIVVHLPAHLSAAGATLVRALAHVTDVTVLVGTTGRLVADGPARAMIGLLGTSPAGIPSPGLTPVDATPTGPTTADATPAGQKGGGALGDTATGPPATLATEVWAAPSADAEVLVAVRRLLRWHAEGTPLERMALLHGGGAPYPRLVEDTLTAAGVPHNGTGTRQLSATVTGRALLGYLELVDGGWRREDVIGWLAAAPLLHRGRPTPTAAWDLVSCDAGVIAGLGEWRERLAEHAAALRRRAAWQDEATPGADEGRGPAAAALRRDADACDELSRFVAGLAARLDDVPDRWQGWAEWCGRLLAELLGGPAARTEWPPEEIAAYDAVADVLGGLAALDELGRRPALGDVRAALQAELESTAPQTSRFGHGILCGRVADAVGLDLDVVWVLGMTDGSFPPPVADDVLVPDRQRERVADEAELPRRGARRIEGERDLVAALAGPAVRVLSYPVGDQRQGGALRPARPLLDALGELAGGRRLFARDLPLTGAAAEAAGSRFVVVPSYAAAVGGDGTPTGLTDWDLRELARWVDAGGRPDRHFLAEVDPVVDRGLALRRSRRSGALTRFDGRVGAGAASLVAGELHTSATTLESYARCPRRYFFAQVLGLSARERPEEVLRISPLDRGVAVHRILERLVAAELLRTAAGVEGEDPSDGSAGSAGSAATGSAPEEGAHAHATAAALADAALADTALADTAGDEANAALMRIADEVFAELEARRLTGHHALWTIDRAAILASLRRLLARDREHRRSRGAVPEAVEQSFGNGGADGEGPAVAVDLGEARHVAFRGRIDRIDRTADGGLWVLDYKSGSRNGDPDGALAEPLAGGTRLQLAVYGAAARRRYQPDGPVVAGYWYLGGEGAISWCEVSDDLEAELAEVLTVVVDGIGRGAFPARPGEAQHRARGTNCATCPFDAMCPSDRQRDWARKRSDPWIADYVALAEPADE